MLHIIHPDYTWFLLYSCLFVTFLVQLFFSKYIAQDSFILIGLISSIIITIPSDPIQDILEHKLTYIKEIILFISSFALVTRYLSKKLILHIVAITFYFTLITIAHATSMETLIIPFASLVIIYSFYITYHSMPRGAIVKNGIYFTTLLMFVLQNLLEYENPSVFYTILYITFATVFACRAFLSKDYSSKVFFTFFAFFILTVAHIFLQIDVVNTVQYLLLYSTISYFLYTTIFPHGSNKTHIIFLFHAIFALLHICYTTLNPQYFLLNIVHSQTVVNATLHYLSTFCYFTIFICAIQLIFRTFRKVDTKNKINWVHFIYATFALIILFEAQFVQKKLSSTSDISYFGVIFAAFVHIFYLVITYSILMTARIISKKAFSRAFSIRDANNKKRLRIVNPFQVPTKNIIIAYLKGLKSFQNFEKLAVRKAKLLQAQMQTNLNAVQSGIFVIIPAFLCYYMIISICY